MRWISFGTTVLAASLCTAIAHAQHPNINDRLQLPAAAVPAPEADSYLGVTVAQLVVALGLSLQAPSPIDRESIYLIRRPRTVAAAPASRAE